MKIIHRLGERYEETVVEKLQDIGVDCPKTAMGLSMEWLILDLDEADPKWPEIKAILDDCGVITCVRTEFTVGEVLAAQWLHVGAWHNGYPMPDDDFGYLDLTYDLSEYCERCGIGAKQKGPFRIRGEPKWGTRAVMQLNWVFDEVFVRPEIWRTFFFPLGIECRPVLAHKKETELKTVVQLRIDTVLDAELELKEHPFDVCEFCQRKKYLPFPRGRFPAMTRSVQGVHAVKSKEWFGSGASAHRAVLISGDVVRQLVDAKTRGADFTPLEPS